MSEDRIKNIETLIRARIKWARENPCEAGILYGYADRRNAPNFLARYMPSATLKHQAEQIAKEILPRDMEYRISETMTGDVLFVITATGVSL